MKYSYEPGRIFANDENGKTIAEVTFKHIDETTIDVDHTFVDESLRGQGVANELMVEVSKLLEEKNWKAVPTCSYAVKWSENEKNDASNFVKK
ncbi:MAG: GNAT family N-acetyltransferase [Filifactor alocis]|nr:GNAT family N-acetyltransferase [Filifactor alocis]